MRQRYGYWQNTVTQTAQRTREANPVTWDGEMMKSFILSGDNGREVMNNLLDTSERQETTVKIYPLTKEYRITDTPKNTCSIIDLPRSYYGTSRIEIGNFRAVYMNSPQELAERWLADTNQIAPTGIFNNISGGGVYYYNSGNDVLYTSKFYLMQINCTHIRQSTSTPRPSTEIFKILLDEGKAAGGFYTMKFNGKWRGFGTAGSLPPTPRSEMVNYSSFDFTASNSFYPHQFTIAGNIGDSAVYLDFDDLYENKYRTLKDNISDFLVFNRYDDGYTLGVTGKINETTEGVGAYVHSYNGVYNFNQSPAMEIEIEYFNPYGTLYSQPSYVFASPGMFYKYVTSLNYSRIYIIGVPEAAHKWHLNGYPNFSEV